MNSHNLFSFFSYHEINEKCAMNVVATDMNGEKEVENEKTAMG